MNALEAARLIDVAVNLGHWPREHDGALVADQAEAWAMVLADVPYDFGLGEVRIHSGPYSIRPSLIRGVWENKRRAEREVERGRYDEAACPWARVCTCTHDHGCYRGWMQTADGESGQWCARCWDAKNVVRSEKGKDPLPVGVMGANR